MTERDENGFPVQVLNVAGGITEAGKALMLRRLQAMIDDGVAPEDVFDDPEIIGAVREYVRRKGDDQ